MKILHAFRLFSLQTGGGTVDLMYKIMKALCNLGHEVTLYTTDFELDQEYLDSLIPVKYKVVRSYTSLNIMPSLGNLCREDIRNYDIIHLHAQRSLMHPVICHHAIKNGIPYVIDAHGSTPIFNKRVIKNIYDSTVGQYIYNNCSQFIAENKLGENEYVELGIVSPRITVITPPRDRITIINPPMEVEGFNMLPDGKLFKDEYQLPDKKIIMFLGRINKVKGINYLIDGFYELLKSRKDIILVIAGSDDGDLDNLKRQVGKLGIDKFVVFTGFVNGMVKLSGLVAASVVVQPSVYEQGAWCPLEALLCGTPAIVSSHTGAGLDMKEIDGGYLVDIYNPQEVALTIDYVLNHQEEARARAEKGAEYIRTNLSLATSIQKYEAMYEKCLGVKNAFN